jgi:hypothetical protein
MLLAAEKSVCSHSTLQLLKALRSIVAKCYTVVCYSSSDEVLCVFVAVRRSYLAHIKQCSDAIRSASFQTRRPAAGQTKSQARKVPLPAVSPLNTGKVHREATNCLQVERLRYCAAPVLRTTNGHVPATAVLTDCLSDH